MPNFDKCIHLWDSYCHHLRKLPYASFLSISALRLSKTTVQITFYHRLVSGHHMNGIVQYVCFFIKASTQHEGFILLLYVSAVCFFLTTWLSHMLSHLLLVTPVLFQVLKKCWLQVVRQVVERPRFYVLSWNVWEF